MVKEGWTEEVRRKRIVEGIDWVNRDHMAKLWMWSEMEVRGRI